MRYINAIIKLLTFPGGFFRGFWEQVLCKSSGVPVENRKCFQFNEMAGHIEHEPFPTARKSVAFCMTSGIMVFLAGVVFAIPAVLNLFYLGVISQSLKVISFMCLYLAFSMFTNLFPSVEDALMMWEKYKSMKKVSRIILAPAVGIMYIGAKSEGMGITFVTNIIITAVLIFI